MNSLVEVLYFLSTALLIPVVVVLLGFVMWSLLEFGGFVREMLDRRHQKSAWKSFLAKLDDPQSPSDNPTVAAFFHQNVFTGLPGSFATRGHAFRDSELQMSKLVSDLEIEAASRLARMSLGIRVGPILGLMGTLIPLGPALIGLSTGNIQDMARHLVVAFSTTVLGLFVGGTCYGIWLARRQWYAGDLADIEFIYNFIFLTEGTQPDETADSQPKHEALRASTIAR